MQRKAPLVIDLIPLASLGLSGWKKLLPDPGKLSQNIKGHFSILRLLIILFLALIMLSILSRESAWERWSCIRLDRERFKHSQARWAIERTSWLISSGGFLHVRVKQSPLLDERLGGKLSDCIPESPRSPVRMPS
jgi:hypothetical protein